MFLVLIFAYTKTSLVIEKQNPMGSLMAGLRKYPSLLCLPRTNTAGRRPRSLIDLGKSTCIR